MRDDSNAAWPPLGYRFEQPSHFSGSAGLFTCAATDLLLGRNVTLRLVTDAASAHARESFQHDVDALSRLRGHPAAVELLDHIVRDDAEIVVLERLERGAGSGVTGLSPRRAVSVVVHLAGVLDTAHRIGLVHAGVRPDHLYRDEAGSVKLAGFAGRLGDGAPLVVHHVTPHTAPELLLGEPVDARVDVYGLGTTLFELLTGQPPFRTYPGDTPAALALRILTGASSLLDRPEVPLSLRDVIEWAMSVSVSDRPPAVSWIAEELGRIERAEGWPKTPVRVSAIGDLAPAPQSRSGARHRAG